MASSGQGSPPSAPSRSAEDSLGGAHCEAVSVVTVSQVVQKRLIPNELTPRATPTQAQDKSFRHQQ